jgi:hypothetical protein
MPLLLTVLLTMLLLGSKWMGAASCSPHSHGASKEEEGFIVILSLPL